jgi:hypothetical protein
MRSAPQQTAAGRQKRYSALMRKMARISFQLGSGSQLLNSTVQLFRM